MTNFELIEEILDKNRGYITKKDINSNGISSAFLSQYVKKKNC